MFDLMLDLIRFYQFPLSILAALVVGWAIALFMRRMRIVETMAPERWRHRKTGRVYLILHADAKLQMSESRVHDNEPAVIYQSEDDGLVWVRPRNEFLSRFEKAEGRGL